ncbi:DUF5694 domain-containing protein [Ornithinibacillus halophilus]|uniref:TraB family protein n=1 Tax=Ornithinibacillus halophilus TaxID=930117 RepID=A0A1M5MK43_9BACI|nr:DUF5694 domain-containing protein [Ornithinibacillus halophilus]SHG77547.1 hypothetical protein SAMN05216225_106010 [Ornithinibacillus halophilus]
MLNIKPTIFILGTDHFSGHDNGDMFQSEKQDMLSNRKQNEIKEVIACLKKFEPTKVALEYPQELQSDLNERYVSYLNKDYTLTINEFDQIGLRLAKECKHNQVYAVDWNKDQKDIPDMSKWKDTDLFKEVTKIGEDLLYATNTYKQNHSLKDFLLWLNQTPNILKNQEIYMKLALVGNENNPDGATWTAKYWYYRNMLIYKNLVNLIDNKEERIFVLYGFGHLHLLLQFLRESGIFDVKVASDYLS